MHLNCTVHWAQSTPIQASALSTQCTTNLEHSHALSTQCRLTWQALALSVTDLLGIKVQVRASCVVLAAIRLIWSVLSCGDPVPCMLIMEQRHQKELLFTSPLARITTLALRNLKLNIYYLADFKISGWPLKLQYMPGKCGFCLCSVVYGCLNRMEDCGKCGALVLVVCRWSKWM